MSCEAERVIKSLTKAVAAKTDTSQEVVATRFWQRLGIDLLRGNCKAFQKRLPSVLLASFCAHIVSMLYHHQQQDSRT